MISILQATSLFICKFKKIALQTGKKFIVQDGEKSIEMIWLWIVQQSKNHKRLHNSPKLTNDCVILHHFISPKITCRLQHQSMGHKKIALE